MQRPTGAPLPPLGPFRDQSRTQPDQGETSPSSFSSIFHHSPVQHVTTRKRILQDSEVFYPNKRTPLPKHPQATTIDHGKETVPEDGSIYHLNALMTTKMMTEEMREQILDIIESGSRRMIPMCTVPRAPPEDRRRQNLDESSKILFGSRPHSDLRIGGRHRSAHERNPEVQAINQPIHVHHQRSTSPCQTLQFEHPRPVCSDAGSDHHRCQTQQSYHQNRSHPESPQHRTRPTSMSTASIQSTSRQDAQPCCEHHHPDQFLPSHRPICSFDYKNSRVQDIGHRKTPQPLELLTDRHDSHRCSPTSVSMSHQSPRIEACRGTSLTFEESERQAHVRERRDGNADITMSTRTTRTGEGDLDTSYGLELELDSDKPTRLTARPRNYEDDEDEDGYEEGRDDTGDEQGSEVGTVAGKVPRSKTRIELASAILSHPDAQLLEGALRCPNCRNAKRSVKECWVIAGKKGKCAPCTKSSQKCPFLVTLPGTIDEDQATSDRTASISNTIIFDITQTVCDFAAQGKTINNLLSAWEPGNPAFEGFARRSLEAVAKDIFDGTSKLKDLLKEV